MHFLYKIDLFIFVILKVFIKMNFLNVPYSPENNAALYEILSNKNLHHTRGLHNFHVLITLILCQFSRLIFEFVL